MDPHRAVFERTVVGWLAENCMTYSLLSELLGVAAQSLLGYVKKQLAETSRLVKGRAANDALNQLPPFVAHQGLPADVVLQRVHLTASAT